MPAGILLLTRLTAVPAVVIALLVAGAGSARAQDAASGGTDPGRIALMPSASLDPSLRELADALDPVLLAQLEAVVGVTAAARPALDLPAMQLALDCVGETPECLSAVAGQTATDSLLAPSVQLAGAETVVTLLYYDGRGRGELRSVVRRHAGGDVQRATLDAVPGMLRELFAIAESAASEPVAEPEPEPVPSDGDIEPAVEPVERPFPVGPVIAGSVGVVLIGVGIAFGLAANASEDEWTGADPGSMAEVDDAYDTRDDGQTQALLFNVGVGAGAVVLAGSAVWLALELSSDPGGEVPGEDVAAARKARPLALRPAITPRSVGVGLQGSF